MHKVHPVGAMVSALSDRQLGLAGRPAVATKLLEEQDALTLFIRLLRTVTPAEQVQARNRLSTLWPPNSGHAVAAPKCNGMRRFATSSTCISRGRLTAQVATCTFLRRPHGALLWAIKELIESAQTGGRDLTPEVMRSGYPETLVASLGAVKQVGAENCNGRKSFWL
eukprot:SAG11_NODE_86_length_17300_cov_11.466717_21_plen_167_part_00